jgi:heptaprenyl diphosphate synthase
MARDRLEPLLEPRLRFAWGVALILLFVLQRHLAVKALEVLCFAILATLAGKRVRWGYFVVLTLSITAFNLLSPWGQVIIAWGPVRITRGALETGLAKGLTIVGLVFVSLFTVSRYLRLPGRFGGFLARSLLYFELLYDQRRSVNRRGLIADVDQILEDTLARGRVGEDQGRSSRGRSTLPGLITAFLITCGAAVATIISRMGG